MSKAILTQIGVVENPALLPEDETRPNGQHALEGVAFLLQKKVEDLAEIEVLPGVGAFHKARDGKGAYLVDVRDMTCSCPGFKFRRSCGHVAHVEERIKAETFPAKKATFKPRKMTDDELAARKARIDARNAKLREERAAKKAAKPRGPFRPINPDEAEATA